MNPPRRTLLGPTASVAGPKVTKDRLLLVAGPVSSQVPVKYLEELESPKGVNLPEAHLLQGKEERGHHLDSVRSPRQNITEGIPKLTQHQIQASLTQLH